MAEIDVICPSTPDGCFQAAYLDVAEARCQRGGSCQPSWPVLMREEPA
jgi:hypothetical protein